MTPAKQTSFYLHENYGRSLEADVVAVDAFYAMTGLMLFVASSISQLLALVEDTIADVTKLEAITSNDYDVSNLSYHQQMLDGVIRTLRENIRTIQMRGSAAWPHATEAGLQEKAERAAALLLVDYEELLHRARSLYERCENNTRLIMNQAAIAESKRSLRQTTEVVGLTRLASIFVPVTFATSFLGMNMAIFGQGTIPIWAWFVIALPLTILTFVLMYGRTWIAHLQTLINP